MVPFDRPHTISYQSFIATMFLSCTVSAILSLISENLKRSRNSEHILFGSNISCMHLYSSVSISIRNFKCLASPFAKTWLGQNFKNGSRDSNHALLWVVCYRRLGLFNWLDTDTDTVYLHAKLDDFSFSRSTDIIWASKFKVFPRSRDHDHAHFKGNLPSLCRDLT